MGANETPTVRCVDMIVYVRVVDGYCAQFQQQDRCALKYLSCDVMLAYRWQPWSANATNSIINGVARVIVAQLFPTPYTLRRVGVQIKDVLKFVLSPAPGTPRATAAELQIRLLGACASLSKICSGPTMIEVLLVYFSGQLCECIIDSLTDTIVITALQWRSEHKPTLIRAALGAGAIRVGRPAGGACDRRRYLALWTELHGVHVPFGADQPMSGSQGALVHRYRMDDLDVLDPEGLYKPVYKPEPSRGEIGAALTHAKAWMLTYLRQRPMVVLEDDVVLRRGDDGPGGDSCVTCPSLLKTMDMWINGHYGDSPGWDWFHFGIGTDHGGEWSPVSTTDGCRARNPVRVAIYMICKSSAVWCVRVSSVWTVSHFPMPPLPPCSHHGPTICLYFAQGDISDCYADWEPEEVGTNFSERYGFPDKYRLWKPRHVQHGFLGYMLAPAGAQKMMYSLPAGADVDNWYSTHVMNTQHSKDYPFKDVLQTRSFTVWPNLLGKSWEVDASDTHVPG